MLSWCKKQANKFYNRLAEQSEVTASGSEYWRASIADKEKLTIQDAKFIFDQAEKTLKDSVDSSETIVSRMNTLITIITGSLIALIGYLIAKISDGHHWDHSLITPGSGIVCLYGLAILSFGNNRPIDYLLPGSLPKDLFDPLFFVQQIQNEERILRYYVNEIENYQAKIEANSEINNQRWGQYTFIMKLLLLFLPPILLVSLLIADYFVK